MIVNYRSLTFSLLFFLSFSHGYGTSHFLASQTPLPSVSEAEAENVAVFAPDYNEGPSFAPVVGNDSESSSLVLAAKRTYRQDPLNGFKRYSGGWNIKDRHYWASVAYTAAPLFVIAAIWFLGFGACLLFICIFHFCCKRKPYGYSKTAYALSLIFLIFFTIAAIIGCVVLYAGQVKFRGSTKKTLEYVVYQADTTVQKLQEVSNNLATAKQISVQKVFLPSNVQSDIDNVESKLNSSASTVADETAKNSHDIRDLLDSVRLALILIAAIMLVLTFLGFFWLSLDGYSLLEHLYYVAYSYFFIIHWDESADIHVFKLAWSKLILIFLPCISVAGDTCVAMNEYVQNPAAHTALDSIIPCVDKATAQDTLTRTKEVTSQLVEVVNEVITNVSNINFAPAFVPFYFNQSGPLVPILCNPFHPDFTDRTCTAGELNLNNATQALSNYVCQVSPSGVCTTTGRLTPPLYDDMTAAVNLCNGLENYGPFLAELQDCTFVRETFNEIYRDHCPDLQAYSKWIYVGLAMVSTAVMLSLIFWVIYGRERRYRIYTKQSDHQSLEEGKDAQDTRE
ncbi:transmembrane protein [Citrus sinensis]|uniref:Transmembrane protein n=1 Tax=Citrus sinensis TaxID=2711 RepID=A0ACB8NM78_CITSI|nr:transmembrane protein [Citrus sinensis]